MDIDTQPLYGEPIDEDTAIRIKALQDVYETSRCFQGGSQITPENHAQSVAEYRLFREATAKARSLKLTPYSIQLALKGEINPMWIA